MVPEVVESDLLLEVAVIEELLHGAHVDPVDVPVVAAVGYLLPAAVLQHLQHGVLQEAPEADRPLIRALLVLGERRWIRVRVGEGRGRRHRRRSRRSCRVARGVHR